MKKLLCIVTLAAVLVGLFAVFATANSSTIPFKDVPEKAWYHPHVSNAYEMGLMKGKTTTKFDPLADISRAEIIMILANVADADTAYFGDWLADFSDGDTEAWYADAVGWAYANGIVAGYDDGTIRATNKITRAEIVKMVGGFINLMGYDLVETNPDVTFTDARKIASWYKTELYAVAEAGIILGDNKGNFNPSKKATRAEAATIAVALANAIEAGYETNGVVVARDGADAYFSVMYSGSNSTECEYLTSRINGEYSIKFPSGSANDADYISKQFLLGYYPDADYSALAASLKDDEFAIKVKRDGNTFKLMIAYTTPISRTYAIEYLLTKYAEDGVIRVPTDLDYKQTVKYEDFFINYDSINVAARDPFLFYEDGTYYIYTTTGNNSKPWRMWKNTKGLDVDAWEGPFYDIFELPADFNGHAWAPEVHKYNGSYYMFATYRSDNKLNDYSNHGVAIFKADSPEGPFKLHSDGWITYKKWSDEVDGTKWDTIDGTLYVDAEGQPWIIFTHEHTSMPGHETGSGNGSFMAAKLSDDLSEIISEPFDLFYALDTSWAGDGITDGCFPYVTEDGDLLIMWSNFTATPYSYCIAFARSSDGTIYGDWSHNEPMLYHENMTGVDSGGGHGMIFTDVDGQMYICCHSPTDPVKDNGERELVTLFPVIERNGMLVWDLNLD